MRHPTFFIETKFYVAIIDLLISIADVHVVYNLRNHDYTNGFFLAQVIEPHFQDFTNVTFSTTILH